MSNQPSLNNDNPILTYYREWSDKTPYVTRVSMIALLVTYLISFVLPLDTNLGNTTYFSILNFEVYRLFLSPMVGNSIFNIVLIALFFPGMGARMETSIGSSAFLFVIGTLTVATNIIFVVLCLFLYYIANVAEAIFYSCSGFWLVLFGLITMECLLVIFNFQSSSIIRILFYSYSTYYREQELLHVPKYFPSNFIAHVMIKLFGFPILNHLLKLIILQNPDQPRRMMMVPVDIPSKFFPLIMYALFCLFTGPKLDYAIAMGVGYLYQKGHLDRIKPSSYFLEGLESPAGMLHSISRNKGWILAGAAIGHDAWIAVNSSTAGGGAGAQQGSSSSGGSGSAPAGRGGFGAWAAQENGAAASDGGADSGSKSAAPVSYDRIKCIEH